MKYEIRLLLDYICVDMWIGDTTTVPANGDGGVGLELPAADQTEIIFMGTGTSEGVPRVSCLTNPSNKCPVL